MVGQYKTACHICRPQGGETDNMAYARLRVTERGNVRSGFFFGTLLRGLVCELLHPLQPMMLGCQKGRGRGAGKPSL